MATRPWGKSLTVQKSKLAFRPHGPWDAEIFDGIPEGAIITVRIEKEIQPAQLSKYMAVLDRVLPNTPFRSKADLRKTLMAAYGTIGHFRTNEGTTIEPGSETEFDAREFSDYLDWAFHYICDEICPGLDYDALLKERRVVINPVDDNL